MREPPVLDLRRGRRCAINLLLKEGCSVGTWLMKRL